MIMYALLNTVISIHLYHDQETGMPMMVDALHARNMTCYIDIELHLADMSTDNRILPEGHVHHCVTRHHNDHSRTFWPLETTLAATLIDNKPIADC